MIVVAVFESPTVVAGLDHVAVVGQAVEQRGGHLGVGGSSEWGRTTRPRGTGIESTL
jgi:hypothetical protein